MISEKTSKACVLCWSGNINREGLFTMDCESIQREFRCAFYIRAAQEFDGSLR